MKMTTYTITLSGMGAVTMEPSVYEFTDWTKAYAKYNELVDQHNLGNAEYCGCQDMNLTAGGIAYDYRVELTVNEA